MATTVLWANNAKSTLALTITNIQTTITLSSGTGALFPNPGAGQYFPVTLQSASDSSVLEICYCTSRSGDVLTVTRAQEGTTALAFNAGDNAENLLTAGTAAAFGQLAGANVWTGSNVFDQLVQGGGGFLSTGWDTGGFAIRVTNGNYGAGIRNDGTSVYLLQTASGQQTGSFNSFRPYAWNLSTGAVTIDGTGVGTSLGGTLTVGKSLTVSVGNITASTGGLSTLTGITASTGNITASTGRVRAGSGARGSGDSNACTILADFTSSWPQQDVGYTEDPTKTFDQTFVSSITATGAGYTTVNVNLPTAFPSQALDAVVCFYGNLPQLGVALGAAPIPGNRSQVQVTANSTGATSAMGIVIRARGN